MEIFELLIGLAQLGEACGCFLELFSLGANGSALYSGVRTYQKRKKAKEQAPEDQGPPLKKPSWWPFVLLLFGAVFLTGLLVIKYTRPGR